MDAKGSLENESTLCRFAAATGRADDVLLFTLNPSFVGATYNPLYMAKGVDPRGVAERVFSTFEPEMSEPYYRDMARELFVNLVIALASTGKQMCMLDILACVSDVRILLHALEQASDAAAVWRIKNRVTKLGDKFDHTFSSLVALLSQYDHPAVNAYSPDIVLERDLESGCIVGFSLPANAYKFLARSIGLIVFQHLQQVGAMRQMRRGPHVPISVFADEFYTFAYEGFIDAVNKLRDADISLLLSHQSLSDLERVSPEFARGIWDNTRNKILLYANDSELCERIAQSVGTRRDVELTVRRAADSYLNQVSMLEASSREVDEFILHPNQLKNLKVGQAYLVQAGVGGDEIHKRSWWRRRKPSDSVRAVGTHLPLLPALPDVERPSYESQGEEVGLGLYDRFIRGAES